MTEKILTLTLEIICLLTGEDCIVVKKKSGENVTASDHLWAKSPAMYPLQPLVECEKILEVTNKILELLSGEVPIRCQDVSIHFSLEEWDYIEEHKDQYKDIMMEDLQNLMSQGLPKSGSNECPLKEIKQEQGLYNRENLTDFSIYIPDLAQPAANIKERLVSCDGINLKAPNTLLPINHIQPYSPADIKEEPASQGEGQRTSIYTPNTQHLLTHIKENSVRDEGGSSIALDRRHQSSGHCVMAPNTGITYTPTDITPIYSCTPIMEEHVPSNNGGLTDPSQLCPSTNIMEKLISCNGGILTGHYDTEQYTSTEGEDKDNNSRYIFTEHTYTHLSRRKCNLGAEKLVEDFMKSLPHMVGPSSSVEGFATDAGLAEIQYVSNHVGSSDWCPTKASKEDVFLSKCLEYEKHFCQVSQARICGTHLTEWSINCSECQNCLNATLKLIRQHFKHREESKKSLKKTEKKEFSCLDCGKHFPNNRYLLTHRRVHSEANPFLCPVCGQNFEDQEGFVAHQKNPACQRPFSCSECGKRFKSRYNSEYHKKIHTENKKYLCPVCGKGFRKQSCFIVHERTHTGEKPYACLECGRCFSQNTSLISHQRLHTGEKPFTCLECGRNFTQRISLVVHERVHSGDRPYKCQECGKGFTQRIGLVQHQRRHTGEKPFTCSECGKSFTLHDSLVKHLRTHTGEKPYMCCECGKRFCQSSQLTAHKRFHHATQHHAVDHG
ncbi:hypothetical protein GDO81_022488 [Engystomops pustulosus]|uniref:Uncharacterized protein n=1 Tax=Engystomops pustulosus TaxID=76066 RepID=A0AAV6Z5L2_ENGPU|nr:hypothetical protein GDO81_022488 [Engystomops pustulosus]